MPGKPNTDFHDTRKPEDLREPGSDAKRTQDAERAGKIRDVGKSVRGNNGLAQAGESRGSDGSETEKALKRAADRHSGGDR